MADEDEFERHGHRFRDGLRKYVPWWLSDRRPRNGEAPKTVGWRFLWACVAPLDFMLATLTMGLAAWFPGKGTSTALEWIGRSRGIIRNQDEPDADYALRLINWIETWGDAGKEKRIAEAIHGYLRTHPRVRVVNRAGHWVTIDTDGSLIEHDQAWDWDSVTNPERNDPDEPYWSDLWVIVQPTQWEIRPGGLEDLTGDDHFALGHMASRLEVDALDGLINQWKSAHTRIRAVIWTSDVTLFDPENPSSLPNGRWGTWGIMDGDSYVPSDRNVTTCRYWEF